MVSVVIVPDASGEWRAKTDRLLSLLATRHSPLPALVGRPDDDQPVGGARDGAADEDEVVLGVDADDVEVADGRARAAVAAGHADALLGAAAAAVAGVGGDAAVLAVALLDAVAAAQALEVVPLHVAGEAAALARADHVHPR